MSDKKTLLRALVTGIRQDVTDYERLQHLLAAQRQLMLGRDNDGLLEHNRTQDALVDMLAQRSGQRGQLLLALGVSADADGMARLLRVLPASIAVQLQGLWQRLLELVTLCQAANEQNGRLLVRQQELIRELLQVTPASGYPQP